MTQSSISGAFSTLKIPDEALEAYRAGKEAAAEQRYAEAADAFSMALRFANLPNLFIARALEQRGVCAWLMGEYDAAERDFDTALSHCDNLAMAARIRPRLGDVADARGDYEAAATIYNEALREGLTAGDLLAIGRAQHGLGVVNRRRGQMEQSLNYLTQALASLRQAGDALEQARVLLSIGRTRHARGEYQQALSADSESLNILEALRDRWQMVLLLNDLGECYQALYDLEMAMRYHLRALKQAEQFGQGMNIIMPDIQRNMGVNLLEMGRVQESVSYLKEAWRGASQMGNLEQEVLALYQLARAQVSLGQFDSADGTVSRLGKVADALSADRYRALAAFARGELFFARGDRARAMIELNIAMLKAQSSFDRGMLWKLHAAISHAVEDEAVAGVHRQIAADFVQQTADPLQDLHLRACFINAAPVTAVLTAAGLDPEKLLRAS